MIPPEKISAVTRGLQAAFGVTEFEDIRQITKGRTSALVFRIIVQGRPYLLRIIMHTNSMLGPTRHFTCLKIAAQAGLAPHVWYTSTEDQISITDFVEEVAFPASNALVRMPRLLRSLHALPPFPEGVHYLDTTCMFLMHQGPARDGLIQKIRESNALSKGETGQLLAWHQQLSEAYPQNKPDMVSSHNDLFKPDNILFDGSRVWLIDWEAAFLNDRYADLAVIANLLVTNDAEENDAEENDAEENAYLHEYFGQSPDPYQGARFFLMQQLVHMFYAMAFLILGSTGKPVDQSEKAPGFHDFNRRFWAGEVSLTDNETKLVYGRVHWERLVHNMGRPRFSEALRILAST
jgi:aminoglycoside phosphotransferase (APT) family kinase protein